MSLSRSTQEFPPLDGTLPRDLAPSTLALLSANFPEERERTRAVAYYGAVAGVGASTGLVLGGIFTNWISWRAEFSINMPIGIVMMIAATRYLAETEPARVGLTCSEPLTQRLA